MSAAHAELEQIWPRYAHIRLVGRVAGLPTAVPEAPDGAPGTGTFAPADGARPFGGHPPGGWQLLLVLRERTKHHLRYPAPLTDEGRFDASVPVDDLSLDGLPSAIWDIHLSSGTGTGAGEGSGELRLRAGRHLDDISDKKRIMIFPAQSVASDEDGTLVRPYYTVNNNLSLECLPGDRELLPGEYARPERIV